MRHRGSARTEWSVGATNGEFKRHGGRLKVVVIEDAGEPRSVLGEATLGCKGASGELLGIFTAVLLFGIVCCANVGVKGCHFCGSLLFSCIKKDTTLVCVFCCYKLEL